MRFPRVVVVAVGRINAADASNNGLLLRNLFAGWPRESLAQIYSSGDSGDIGFFGHYYRLGSQDRRLGWMFYGSRDSLQRMAMKDGVGARDFRTRYRLLFRSLVRRLFVDTGLAEWAFRPIASSALLAWVRTFRPDIIFAQGYNLTFTWLPLILADNVSIPICFYPTDDWPSDLYCCSNTIQRIMSHPARRAVERSSRQLVERSSVRIAFTDAMQQEYVNRYKRLFSVLMHGDDAERFAGIRAKRLATPDYLWIVSTGVFDEHRWPLLRDLDRACTILAAGGRRVRATIFAVNIPREVDVRGEEFRHIEFAPCPSHQNLAAVLRGADVLFLPERFDDTAKNVRLCVSSKAHLFMFSGRPIIVYSALETGIAQYAKLYQWAKVVGERDPGILADAIEDIVKDAEARQCLVANAQLTAAKRHNITAIRAAFFEMLTDKDLASEVD